jgi:hypothetical protein
LKRLYGKKLDENDPLLFATNLPENPIAWLCVGYSLYDFHKLIKITFGNEKDFEEDSPLFYRYWKMERKL